MMTRIKCIRYAVLTGLLAMAACDEVLNPEPVNQLSNEVVLSNAQDVPSVEIGLYNALRGTASLKVIAGDLTADMAVHNGTFSEYRELSNKQINPSNAAVSTLWGGLYRTIYIANFILEKLPELPGVNPQVRARVLATAHLLRGYSYFVGAYTYGDMPLITSTPVEANRNVPRASREEILARAEEDLLAALPGLPDKPASAAFAGKNTAKAMLARFYLYREDWAKSAQYASEVIDSKAYTLEPDFVTVVTKDFTQESIFEVGYSVSDDPGTGTYSLNNIFVGRREVIPSNQATALLVARESGDRIRTLGYDPQKQRGSDNGLSVLKYGTADDDNNNIVIFRLGEMYLIRAEARARQGRVVGVGSAAEDVGVLRLRAKAPAVTANTPATMLQTIEQERVYELAYEGHRWYDLVRTGRAQIVLGSFSPNWDERYQVWPVPQREIQNNPSLRNNQNPGY